MSREQNVPLLLWISTAILAHIATGGGAEQVARILEDKYELVSFARTIRGKLQPSPTIEIGFENLPAPTAEPPEPPTPNQDVIADKKKEKKPEIAKAKAPEKKAEPKKIVLPTMVSPAAPPPPQQPPPVDHRIAVKQ